MTPDHVLESISQFLPYRNEILSLITLMAQYYEGEAPAHVLHRFFERFEVLFHRPVTAQWSSNFSFDNYKFICYELFLSSVARFISLERFSAAAYMITRDYYVQGDPAQGQPSMDTYAVFLPKLDSLEYRNQILQLRKMYHAVELLVERCKSGDLDLKSLMQADLILFLYSVMHIKEGRRWWPQTLVYAGNFVSPFEIFSRSKSAAYFDKVKLVLGVDSKESLIEGLMSVITNPDRYGDLLQRFNPSGLIGASDIATKP